MERLFLPERLAVQPAIGCRNDEQPVVGEDSRHLIEQLVMSTDVLDHLERDYRAELRLRELGQLERRGNLELKIGCGIVDAAVLDSLWVNVDSAHRRCRAGENRTSETLTAAEVENPPALQQIRCPEVPVVVLVRDLNIRRPRHASLTGPRDQSRRTGAALHGQRPDLLASAIAYAASRGSTTGT